MAACFLQLRICRRAAMLPSMCRLTTFKRRWIRWPVGVGTPSCHRLEIIAARGVGSIAMFGDPADNAIGNNYTLTTAGMGRADAAQGERSAWYAHF